MVSNQLIVPEILEAEHAGIQIFIIKCLLVFFTYNQTQPNPVQKNLGSKRKVVFLLQVPDLGSKHFIIISNVVFPII